MFNVQVNMPLRIVQTQCLAEYPYLLQGFPLRGGGHSTMEVIPPPFEVSPPLLGPCPPPSEEFFPAARAIYMLTIV